MITAFIISAGITICIREMDPEIQKARKEKEIRKKQILFLR